MFILFGLLIGFAAAIPLGPVNVFIVSQTLKHDFIHGLMAGLTTAAMDTLYCLIALVGFFHFRFDIAPYAGWMKGAATVLLVLLGIRLIRQSAEADMPVVKEKRTIKPSRPIIGVILLYLSNPTIYAFWIAVAGTATAHHLVAGRGWAPVAFAVSCGLGAVLWYLILVRYVARNQDRINPSTFRKLLLFMGIALIGFGLYTFGSIFI
jgi:threonine/homoserine/homoserine lactone efflux protein